MSLVNWWVSANLTLQQLADEHILGTGRRCFLVKRGADTVGLMTLHRIRQVPQSDWGSTTAAQVMVSLEEMKRISPASKLRAAFELMDHDGVDRIPAMADSQGLGMLSRDEVLTFLRTVQETQAQIDLPATRFAQSALHAA